MLLKGDLARQIRNDFAEQCHHGIVLIIVLGVAVRVGVGGVGVVVVVVVVDVGVDDVGVQCAADDNIYYGVDNTHRYHHLACHCI